MGDKLEGKCAIVTGSSGIGLSAAIRLARDGAQVHLCGIDDELNAKAQSACKGLRVAVSKVDLAQETDIQDFIARAADDMSAIDIVVNAAGIQTYGTVETTDSAHWDKVMAVNLKACFLTAHHAYPHMKKRGGGSIIHVASVQGHANQPNVLAYATSKGAQHALTRAMAVDCAKDNIRVNSISPGSVRTPLLEFAASEAAPDGRTIDEIIAQFGAAHPIGRVGNVDEIAALIGFLAGPESGFCTGGDYPIDGGLGAILGV